MTNYATSQEDIVTIGIREGIRGAAMVWGADILANGLSNSGDTVQNTATGGVGYGGNSSNYNFNKNYNLNSNYNSIGIRK